VEGIHLAEIVKITATAAITGEVRPGFIAPMLATATKRGLAPHGKGCVRPVRLPHGELSTRDIAFTVLDTDDPGLSRRLLAAQPAFSPGDKQSILEELNPQVRLQSHTLFKMKLKF
jgi:hypothetical protein